MAKFCGNCGGQLDDSAKVCGFCGTPLETEDVANIPEATPIPTNDYTYSDPDKNQKIIKYGIMGGIAVVAVVLVIVIISALINNTGYKGAVNTFMGVYEDGQDFEIEDITDLASSKWEDEDEFLNNYEEYFENAADYFEEETDDDYDISWEISKVVELDEDEVEIFGEYMAKSHDDFDEDILTDVVSVKVKITAEADDDKCKNTIILILTNEDGDWKLFSVEGKKYDLTDYIDIWEDYLD